MDVLHTSSTPLGEDWVMQSDNVTRLESDRDNLSPMIDGANKKHPRPQRTPLFDAMLMDAEHLLSYAVEAGIDLEPDIAKRILAAIRTGHAVWDSPEAGEVAAAITKLAAKLKPVTAETLRASREDAHRTIGGYKRIALSLALFVVPLSFFSFISSGISTKISTEITAANDYLLTLHTQLDTLNSPHDQPPPALVLGELQKFAIEMRGILNHSKQLRWFSPFPEVDPCPDKTCKLELDQNNLKTLDLVLQNELTDKTTKYQEIRDYASAVTADVSLVWGAVGNVVLPVLYALLGACAAVLRAFTQQLTARTFAPTYATPARFYIAGIGGGVIGLFNNVFGQNLSVSPLALAFLVGYAADIFFSFLEGATQNLGKLKQGS
jgi:hypothetical protein